MAIINLQAPEEGRAIVAKSIAEILRGQAGCTAALFKDLRTEELSIADPHQSYIVTLADLAEGRLLAAAKPTSWRYLLIEGVNAVGEAEVSTGDKTGRNLEFLGLNQGPFAAATLVALRRAEELPQVKKQDYELRYLKAPSVYLAAVWLHGQKEDILLPLHQPPGGLKENQPCSEAQVLRALRPAAAQARKFDATFERDQRQITEEGLANAEKGINRYNVASISTSRTESVEVESG